MSRNTPTLLLLLTALTLGLLAGCAQRSAPRPYASNADDRYFIVLFTNIPESAHTIKCRQVRSVFGQADPDTGRHIGFGHTPLLLLRSPIDELQDQVHKAFDLAERFNLPVYFQLDDMHFLSEEIASDPMMTEWADFPEPGQAHGPRIRYWFNWGQWTHEPGIPCFESPHFRQYISQRLQQGILQPLTERLDRLREQDREYLFAGMALGWETHIPNYTPGEPHYHLDPDNPPVDHFRDPPVTMQPWEMVQVGYAALHWRGWTREKLEAAARESGQEIEPFKREILYDVIHDYTEFLARQAHQAGIPREKVFSHIVSLDSFREMHCTTAPPIWTAVNPYLTPGFTMSSATCPYDTDRLMEKIQDAEPGLQRYGAVETYFRGINHFQACRDFLIDLYGSGAGIIVNFGYTDPKHSPFNNFDTDGAVRAVKLWQQGGLQALHDSQSADSPAAESRPQPAGANP